MSQKTESQKTRILLVDDHVIVREGLAETLEREPDFRVCGEAADAPQALALVEATRPHLAIVDLTLKNTSGLELVKDLKARFPKLLVLVLSMHDESLYAERVIRAGARGFISKAEATYSLIKAIRQVLAGEVFLSEAAARLVATRALGKSVRHHSVESVEKLSDRELQILKLLGQGRGARQIGAQLNLDVSTVETYRARLKEKLGLKDAGELLQYAIRWNISHPRETL